MVGWAVATTRRYDPDRHHRRSIRLPGYDYGQPGAYFVTICTYKRGLLFDNPVLCGLAETMWQRIPRWFSHVQLDAWVVMPNHLHGIIVVAGNGRRGEASPTVNPSAAGLPGNEIGLVSDMITGGASPLPARPAGALPGSLGAIIGSFKAVAARRINRLRLTPGTPVWQRNYYEHIVRDERALNAIRQYISDNPTRWACDTYNPAHSGTDPQAADLWQLLQGQ